jgi:hypothetical protein
MLIFAGIAQVFIQMARPSRPKITNVPQAMAPARTARGDFGSQSISVSKSGVASKSAYPGITMVVIGAALLAIGAWLSN